MLKKIVFLALALAMVASSTGCVVVVKTGEESALTGAVEFNAGDNVAGIWESQAIPVLKEQAVDINTFLEEAGGDFDSLADKYGSYSMGDSGELSYTLTGTVAIKEVVSDKKAGYMIVTSDGYTGDAELRIQIGSIFKGSAVRDSIPFIRFGDYKNQGDYAAVSQSIHQVIQDNVIAPMDVSSLVGKEIELTGCFTVNKPTEVLITPVEMNLV